MTHGKSGIQRPGRPDFLGDLAGQRDGYGGNSFLFDDALNQSHGLIAQASARRKDDNVNAIFFQGRGNFRRSFIH